MNKHVFLIFSIVLAQLIGIEALKAKNNTINSYYSSRATQTKQTNTNYANGDSSINSKNTSLPNKQGQATKTNQTKHTFKLPILGFNFHSTQSVSNSSGYHLKNTNNSNTSWGAIYLYKIDKLFNIGLEFKSTFYRPAQSEPDIVFKNSFAFMMHSEINLYKVKNLTMFGLVGVGVASNSIDLKYSRLKVTKSSASKSSYKKYKTLPIFNGTTIESPSPSSYCSNLNYDRMSTNIVKHKDDKTKGTTTFLGKGAGVCMYYDTKDNKNYIASYVNEYNSVSLTTLPWFVGVGLNYDLSWIQKLFYNDLDYKIAKKHEMGVTVSFRYFNNGSGGLVHNATNVSEPTHIKIKYGGFVNLDLGLYFTI